MWHVSTFALNARHSLHGVICGGFLHDPDALIKAQTPRLPDPGRDRILSFAVDHQLNEEQSNALLQSFKQRATLIQGPPGTGKTKLAHCIVCAHEDLSNATTLLTASSNAAVDNLAQTCLQKLAHGLARVCSLTYELVLLETTSLTPEYNLP